MPSLWLLLSLVIIGADYFTKQFALAHLILHEPIVVTPFFNWTLIYNSGAAFGFLNTTEPTWERWFLSGVSLVAAVLFIHWLRTSQLRVQRLAIALIIGGALGNFIDRAFYGYVIDFIQVHAGEHYFPAFNLADSAITVGVGLLLISWVKYERH